MRHTVCHAHCPDQGSPAWGVLLLVITAAAVAGALRVFITDLIYAVAAVMAVAAVTGLAAVAWVLRRDRGCFWRPASQVAQARQLARAEALEWAQAQIAARAQVPAIEAPRRELLALPSADRERVTR